MAQENRLTVQDRTAIITVLLIILTASASFVTYLVSNTENRVIQAIHSVDKKVERVDDKIEKHIDFHMNKLQCKEDLNAKEEDTEETSTSERVEVAWRGERERTEGKTIRKN